LPQDIFPAIDFRRNLLLFGFNATGRIPGIVFGDHRGDLGKRELILLESGDEQHILEGATFRNNGSRNRYRPDWALTGRFGRNNAGFSGIPGRFWRILRWLACEITPPICYVQNMFYPEYKRSG
jgi:hypothetical protein